MGEGPVKVTVTLDDVGASSSVNEAASRLLEAGVVDCLSLLATGGRLEEAAETASVTDAAVSVHLNCVEPPFLSREGFPSSHSWWFIRGASLADDVRREWSMQIERVLSLGLMVTRLDSHQHLHHSPGLRMVILELAGEYGISSVRAAILPDRRGSMEAMLLDRLGRKLARMAEGAGIATPDAMLGFTVSGSVDREYLEGLEDRISGRGTAELVMHPSTVPEWSLYQPEELGLLLSDWFGRWLRAH